LDQVAGFGLPQNSRQNHQKVDQETNYQ